MKEQVTVEGNFMLELEEAKALDAISDETTPLSITKDFGGLYTILCC